MKHEVVIDNKAGTAIPAHSFVMLRLATELSTGEQYFDAYKPGQAADYGDEVYAITGPVDIPSTERGMATFAGHTWVKYKTPVEPQHGETVGPEDGIWEASLGGTGWLVVGLGRVSDELIPVWRESSGGGQRILFEIIDLVCVANKNTYAIVNVIFKSCGSSVPSEWDESTSSSTTAVRVYVYDRTGCYFNEPKAALVGRRGFASYMEQVTDYSIDLGNPVDDTNIGCHWIVDALCCPPTECDV